MKQRLGRSIRYVAEVNGKVVGFANYFLGIDWGNIELATIYHYSEFQGIGIGTALLQQAINELECTVNVEQDKIGMTVYEAKGFETDGVAN